MGEIIEILRTEKLTKLYKGLKAVNEASIVINEGDIYGFIGENGSGKTTFIRMITSLIKADSGSFVLFENDSLEKVNDYYVGAVVETPSLHLNMTAYDNLKTQALIIGLKDNLDLKIQEVLELVGLDEPELNKRAVKNYSLGMKQRLSIAVLLLSEPKFIVLDEPMNGLDPEGIVLVRKLIQKLNQEKKITFLISSHILDELSKVATRYGFIHKGKIIKEITKDELINSTKAYLEVKVNKIDEALTVLKDLKLIDYEIEGNLIKIFQDISINEIVVSFSNHQIDILSIKEKDNTVESYYLSLLGGCHD